MSSDRVNVNANCEVMSESNTSCKVAAARCLITAFTADDEGWKGGKFVRFTEGWQLLNQNQ